MASPRGLKVLLTTTVLALLTGLLTGAASPTSAAPRPSAPAASSPGLDTRALTVRDGRTQPVFSYADAIRETVWVLAPDADGDGKKDRVAVDIARPRELDRTARIPVVMDASPYYSCCGRGNESETKTYDADGDPSKLPLYYDNYFVPRGYAYAAVDMAGTSRSTGCVDQGGRSDVGSVKAVVQWLNGDAKAVDRDGKPVRARWSNGRTGMIGKSYDGTLANGVAATGVKGLETIVPIGGISSWYDYDRYQGLPFSQDYPTWLSTYVAGNRTETVDCTARNEQMSRDDADETGAFTRFWADRDYRRGTTTDARKVRASVFIVHGLQDTNVKTPNFSRWWTSLGKAGVDRKMWLMRVGHVDPFDSERDRWVDTLHRWFDHELWGLRNGIDREPAVSAEVAPNRWVDSRTWPAKGSTTLRAEADGALSTGRPARSTQTFVNDPTQREATTLVPGPQPGRLLWTSRPLASSTRISGSAVAKLRVRTTVPTGQVGVALVDYGPAPRVVAARDGVVTGTTETCHGESTAADDACYKVVTKNVQTTPLGVLARGWARLDGARTHDVEVELTADDTQVPAGHRLGLVLVGASPDWLDTVDESRSTYTVDLSRTAVEVPGDLRFAKPSTAKAPLPTAVPPSVLTRPETQRVPR
ncbi:CocE/NonD family hydrolase [Solicola sp. PLA-1-18]|uniref:CocE/NonD family hydrolase n=1 Tax=Solicola sp. PLA-1-18 TaxID=3380532 RepID=UPI003B7F5DA8